MNFKAKKCFVLLTLSMSLLACADKSKITYVNPAKLLQGYHSAQAQYELLQAKARDWQLRIDSLGTELQALRSAPAATWAAKEQLVQYRAGA